MSEPVVARRAGAFQQYDEGVIVMTSHSHPFIRSQIRPFPRVATYPTSWAGSLTFQQLCDDLAHYVTNVMKGKGIHRTIYLPDCIQHGFMALWPELSKNKSLYQNWREQYQHTICIAGAIPAQIEGNVYQQAELDIGLNPNVFPKYIKRAARILLAV